MFSFFRSIATETLANKMKDLQCGQSVDISSIMSVDDKKTRQWAVYLENFNDNK